MMTTILMMTQSVASPVRKACSTLVILVDDMSDLVDDENSDSDKEDAVSKLLMILRSPQYFLSHPTMHRP